MSTEQWGGIRADWTHRLEGEDSIGVGAEPDSVISSKQEEIEYSVYANSSMTLPGMGEPGPNCGVWKPAEYCENCASIGYAENRCERRTCPNCDGEWSQQRARRIAERLAGARHLEEPGVDRRAIHAVVSPPEGEIRALEDVYSGFRKAYSLVQEKGVRGGVAIFHGFRVKGDVKREYRRLDPDMGIWRWVRDEKSEGWRSLTYWSPHYHIVGLSRDFAANNPSAQGGWVAERIRSLKPYRRLSDTESYDDMVGVSRYLLSHATFEPDSQRDCVRWFGSLATTNFQPDEELTETAQNMIETEVKKVLGIGQGGDPDELPDCDECGAVEPWVPIWRAGEHLQDDKWCDHIGKEAQRRLVAAFEWVIGERKPPPGKKNPRSEGEARESLDSLL